MSLCEVTEGKRLVSLTEAAKLLPTRPNASTLWRWCLKGILSPNGQRIRLKHLRCGRVIMTNLDNLEAFFESLAQAGIEQFEKVEA